MNLGIIHIINNKFSIERNEEYEYIQHYFDYDVNKLSIISIEYGDELVMLEDGCKTLRYNFSVLNNKQSEITFIEDNGYTKYETKYIVVPSKSIVYLYNNFNITPFYNNSCIIS